MGWKIQGEGADVLEVWEDYYGNLWFITEHIDDDIKFGFARLYHCPEFAEWGSFSMNEIKQVNRGGRVWKVTEENWCNINTYEDNLLVEVDA